MKTEEIRNKINWHIVTNEIRKLINKYKPTPYGELTLTNEIVTYIESILQTFASQQSVNRRDELIKFYEWENDYPNYASNKREVSGVVDEYLVSHPEPAKEVKQSDEDRIRETMNTQHENGDDI
jgi:hypothetical protein